MLFNAIKIQEKDLFAILEESDLRYLRETIGKGHYHIKDGCLYVGNICLGDGSKEKANQKIFKNYTKITGAHSYIYMRCPDEGLGWKVDPSEKDGGYEEGHYICVCDSVDLDAPTSNVGWKLAKRDTERIDADGKFSFADDCILNGEIVRQVSRAQAIKDLTTNENIAVVVVTRGVNDRELDIQKISINFAFGVLFIVVIIVAGLAVLVSRHTLDLRKTIDYISKIDKGSYPKEQLKLTSSGTMHDVEQAVNHLVESLKYNKRVSEELEIAKGIQNNMIPKNFDSLAKYKEFSIFADMLTAKEVGGDFYDFFMLDDKHLVLVIADVSGKGVPAAMLMAIAKTLIRNFVFMGLDVSEVLTKTNNLICGNNESNMFITAWLGILNLETGIIQYVNAGHNPPLLCHNNKFEFLDIKSQVVLGVIEDYTYYSSEIKIEPNDKFLVYTDGVTECRNDKSELFGDNRFKEFVNENQDKSPKALIESIYNKLREYANGAEQSDDITMLCVDFHHKLTSKD